MNNVNHLFTFLTEVNLLVITADVANKCIYNLITP